MFDQVISFLMSGIIALFNWFTLILNAIPGSMKYILTFFTLFLITRFILGPVIGSFLSLQRSERGSDDSKSKGGNE